MAKSLSSEKTPTWNGVAKLVRIKGCLETTGLPFSGVCFTCKKRFHIEFLDAGHLMSGRTNVLLLTRKFIKIQCRYCNRTYNGRPKRFRRYMEELHGAEYMDRWISKLKGWSKSARFKDRDINWKERRQRYERMYKIIMRKHGYKTWSELLQS